MKTNFQPGAATLTLSTGQKVDWVFAPRTLLIDDVTDYVIGMYLHFKDGAKCNLILLPSNSTLTEVTRMSGEILAKAGGYIVGNQISIGGLLVDNVISHLASNFAETSIRNMVQHALHAQSSYFAMDNGENVVTRAITAFDIRDV